MSLGREIPPELIRFVHGAAPSLPPLVSQALGLPAMAIAHGASGAMPSASGEELARGLTEQALELLDDVLADPAAGRVVAFRLLAADAFLTWSCEAAADGVAPGEILRSLLQRAAARAP